MQLNRYKQIFDVEKKHWWYQGRRLLLQEILQKLSFKISPRILDFGCGTGSTLSILNDFGTVFGVDKEKTALSFCRKKGFRRVRQITHERLPFPNHSFSIITCLDVLEHISNDVKALKEMRRVLKRGGYLIVFVPAGPYLWSQLDFRSQHKRRYTYQHLYQALRDSGFTVQKISYFNYLFFLPILIIRLLQKTKVFNNTNWGVDPVIKSALINRLLTWIFALDVKSLRYVSPPWGVSLFAVAQNNEVRP